MENITRSQLRHSTEALEFECSGRTKPTVSPDYIVGLTDGEGCFYVLIRSPNQQGGAVVQLNFYIKVQQEDRKMLDKVRNALDCGAVYFQHETRENHAQCYRYTASSQRDVFGKIIPFFQKHQLQSTSKQKNFKLFCQIANLVLSGDHHHAKGIEQIRNLKSQMNRRTRVVR